MEQKSNVRDCENCCHYIKCSDGDYSSCSLWECHFERKGNVTLTVPIQIDKEALAKIVAEKVEEIKDQFIEKSRIEAAIAEIEQERDKSYEGEAIGHGWGMQSALEILRRHLDEDKRNYHR